MRHPSRSSATTKVVVAIFGTGTLSEEILGRLLEREGYHVRHLEAPPTGLIEEPLDGVDVVLVAPGLKDGVREAFLKAMRSTQESAAIPVLPLSSALKPALLDELSAGVSWLSLFEELIGQIRDALARAAEGARALVVECRCLAEPPPPAATQADTL
jgi:hypothetical protein